MVSAPPRVDSQGSLVVHLIYRLDFGGLETLLVDCINRMPAHYRHAVVCLSGYTAFADKITRPGVQLFDLAKAPGLGLGAHARLFKLLRKLRPDVLHTYNLSSIEYSFTAALAGVPVRIHAEHGRDVSDPQGLNPKHNMLRRLMVPFVDRYIPVSLDLQAWLRDVVRIPQAKILLINNGVDTEHFTPAAPPAQFVIGTVGRVQDVKHQAGLIDAFIALRALLPGHPMKLVIVGDGPLRAQLEAQVAAAGMGEHIALLGARSDIADLMRGFSVFALSSLTEGTPVTLLEAMACQLPVVSTAVGGIPALVQDGVSGTLVPVRDAQAMAQALAAYARDPALAARHGKAGRERVESTNSIAAMIQAYVGLYDSLRKSKLKLKENITPCAE
ncbi:TIGR03088 family PEP-CTERM/XrtA system glycosyltransferase [Massilia sp. PAMC28688]|uniref:TIGR03088 family PEP-CTERM/XrtA system glycosyltransferase n=1 Tax=Massilia sp. PAMC28688 TaxID=2861283 RepID=UPI001C63609B|nr:TIGR03088 family PEP-CTERM/XrtA system glycosyltransferase [Massilia sp. PAMC28688]QYF95061.1 TIGR03088 family PEP-CTERM/XrtA system glycosyltransferase [Massilia sp. PAMC28688]